MEEQEGDAPEKHKEDKSVTSQVLDYYRCFSQNRELPKYFCGTSGIQLQDWRQVPAVSPPLVTIPVAEATASPSRDIPIIHIENVCIPSPASSVASNRKLEWDNGADIGYSNSTLHKSVSLPVLTDAEYTKLRDKLLSQNAGEGEDTKRSVEVHCTETKLSDLSSTSESLKSSPKGYISTTPSSGSFLSDSGSSKAQRLKSLKAKVGLPIAQSTQLLDEIECCSTPKVIDRGKIDLGAIDRISRYKNLKLLKLSACKPVVVECAGWTRPPRGKSKTVQTSLSLNAVSVGIQTDFDFENCGVITPTKGAGERQNVFYVCYSDSPTENDSTNCSTMHTQTPSDFSNCDSFQYVDKSRNNSKSRKSESTAESDKENSPVVKLSDNDSLTKVLLNTTRDNRKDGGNVKDLQRTVDLLQKLIRSKKYDSLTKKFYLRAIMKQLVDNKSDSSESVLPQSEVSETEDRSNDKKITKSPKQTVLEKLKTETFATEIPPTSTNSDRGRLKRSRLLTLTDSDLYDTVAASTNTTTKEFGDTNLPLRETNDVHSSLSNKDGTKSWREDKTRSEKRLEEGAGDCHSLGKITTKELSDGIKEVQQLQTKTSATKELQNYNVEQLNGVGKTTTVYVLSTQKESIPSQTEPNSSTVNNNPCACSCRCSSSKPSTVLNTVIEVGGDTIHLQDAHLISSEEFTTKNANARCTTVVRRYTFEIPLQGAPSKNVQLTPVYINDDASGFSKSSTIHKSDVASGNVSEMSGNSKTSKSVSTPGSFSKRGSQSSSKKSKKSSSRSAHEDNEIQKKDSASNKSEGGLEQDTEPPQTLESQKESEGSDERSSRDKISKTQLSSDESAKEPGRKDAVAEPVLSSTNKLAEKISVTDIPKANDDVITYSSQSETTSEVVYTASSGSFEEKNCDHLTGELVYLDEIPSSYQINLEHVHVQGNKSGRNATLSKELVYSDSIPSTTDQIPEKIMIELCDCCKTSKSSSSTCVCCKEREAQTASKCCQCSSTQSTKDSEKYILCYPCYNYHQQFVDDSKPYFREGYVCQCQTNQKATRGTIKEIKKTIQQLENLESTTELCHCDCSCDEVISSTNFCEHCNCRLRPRYRRRKGGLAYCVTLESDENIASNEQNYSMEALEEIKIKVPSPNPTSDHVVSYCNSKSCKAKNFQKSSNLQCKRGRDKQAANKMSDASTKCSHCLYSCRPAVSNETQTTKINHHNRTNKTSQRVISTYHCEEMPSATKGFRASDLDHNQIVTECEYPRSKGRKEKPYTLQEYLCQNRPRFVVMAEQRRQCLLDLAAVREEHSEKYRKLLATTQKPMSLNTKRSQNKVKRPFSSREMKQLTAKNYKKCPEVQQKLVDVRERQIKKANKLIYDVFNQIPSKPHRLSNNKTEFL
ncbi:hypothetical protein PPYR_11818 [Photinus pyralis]|uniref:ALMS motif domain-containing protein n=1 Tax=Photinus pyralis TaxID=7054 RepID=A0A5N4ACG4_PHOPY|nr:uncharacterized protein LOC116176461 isoform X2 [Photinus pyralis]KAB0794979.1 hypothetical protein PPYR_11818 [Photinus pyralis]